ncbi:MAG: hypothetical protein GC159_02260 [Phycisphaera sp.]|nr:hypothetical protein [Phycisphaera sp.]
MSNGSGYDRRYIAAAVAMVLDHGYSFKAAADELQVPPALLHMWVEESIDRLADNGPTHGQNHGGERGNGRARAGGRGPEAHHNRLDIYGHDIEQEQRADHARVADVSRSRVRKPDDSEMWMGSLEQDSVEASPVPASRNAARHIAQRTRPGADQTLDVSGGIIIKYCCEHCGQKLRSNDHLFGKVLECPGCGYNTSAPTHARDPRVYMFVHQPSGDLTLAD